MPIITPDLQNEIIGLAQLLAARFTQPEFIPGCEVVDITDINLYAANNGWIEAVCGQHNQQRVRWKSTHSIAVSSFIDVIYFADRRLFEAWSVGGGSALSIAAANITVDTADFETNLSAADDTVQKALDTLDDLPIPGLFTDFLYNTASDITGYKLMSPTHSAGGVQSVNASISGAGTVIEEFATASGSPNLDFLNDGLYHVHIHAAKTAGTKIATLYAEIYRRTSGGTETLLGTTSTISDVAGSETEYDLDMSRIEADLDLTDRLVVKILSSPSGGGSTPTVTIYYEGTTFSRLEFPGQVNGAASSGNVWPLPDKLNIGATEYSTAAAALAALATGDQLLIGEGSFSCDNETATENVAIHGAGVDVSVLTVANAASTLTLAGTALQLQDLSVTMTAATTAGAAALQLTGTDAQIECRAVKATMVGAAGGTHYAIYINTDSDSLDVFIDCYFASSGTGTNWAFYLATGNVRIEGGYIDGNITIAAAQTLILDGPVITGTITNSGTISGHYYDATGNLITLSGTGQSGGVWLYDADGLRKKYDTLLLAAAAAGAGDVIHLFPGTYTLTAQLAFGAAFTIQGEGPETIINCTTNSVSLLLLNSAGAGLRNLKITHSGAGSTNGGICVTAAATIENVTVTLSGAATANYAIFHQGGTATFTNVTATASGATTNHAYRNDTADVAVTFNGGRLSGTQQDVYGERAGSSLYLNNTVLAGRLADWDGSVDGPIDPRFASFANEIYQGANVGLSDFVATINGAPSGASVVYNAPSSGNEAMLVPTATTQIAKMVLHNTTRSTDALISNCNTGTNTITLTANAPAGWVSGDTITVRSQTNTSTFGSSYFVDFEIVSDVDSLAAGLEMELTFADSGGAGQSLRLHPYQASVVARRRGITTQSTTTILGYRPLPLVSRRFCATWTASGSSTVTALTFRVLKQLVYGL